MQRFILSRFIQAVFTLWVVSIGVFVITRLTGNPLDVLLPIDATREMYEAMAQKLGLDKPLPVQYGIFFMNVIHGSFGESLRFHRPALDVVMERFPATLQLGTVAFVLTLAIAIPIGVYAATRRGTVLDKMARGFAVLGQSLPNFWTGIILILIFAVWLHWLPTSGYGGIKYFILPAVTLGYYVVAGVMRLTRSAMMDVLDAEYIKLARSKGLRESVVIWKHAFKNAALSVLTYSVVLFVTVLAGSVVTETVFAWPGMGRLLVDSVAFRDYPVIQAIVLLFAVVFMVTNLLVDVTYALLDPRIRYQ